MRAAATAVLLTQVEWCLRRFLMMRLHTVLGSILLVVAAGCAQSSDEPEAASAQGDVLPDAGVAAGQSRNLSPELPGDDPVFLAATDAYNPEGLEQRASDLTGLRVSDVGSSYFGQRFTMSLWAPVSPDVAMSVCHELVEYANEIDFPATEIVVREKNNDDLMWSQDLVAVDATGSCSAVDA